MAAPSRFSISLVCGAALAATDAGVCVAESVPGAPKSVFIELSMGHDAENAPPRIYANGETRTRFVDLTTPSDPPSAAPPAPVSTHIETLHRHVDLTNGAWTEDYVKPEVATPGDSGTGSNSPDPNDPYEAGNRRRFRTHVILHRDVIDPVESAYVDGVPEPARVVLHNFLNNLESPTVFLNDVFQGDLDRALTTLSRFVLNSTFGIGGMVDVAERVGLSYHHNDFGQTLASFGWDDYPYLLVPAIGPSNPRDLTGKVVDFVLDPLHFVAVPGGILTSIGHVGADQLDKRSQNVGELDDLARTARDPYATERDMSRMQRSLETGTDYAPQ